MRNVGRSSYSERFVEIVSTGLSTGLSTTLHDPKFGLQVHVWANHFGQDIAYRKLCHTHVIACQP